MSLTISCMLWDVENCIWIMSQATAWSCLVEWSLAAASFQKNTPPTSALDHTPALLVHEAPHWKYDISGLGSEIKRYVLILANTVSLHSLPGKALVSNTAWQMRFSLLSVLQQAFLSVVLEHSCLICYQLSAPETWSFRKAKSSSASIVHVVV